VSAEANFPPALSTAQHFDRPIAATLAFIADFNRVACQLLILRLLRYYVDDDDDDSCSSYAL